MPFDPKLWNRFQHQDIPVYVRGDRPDWFVPNDAGDNILRSLANGHSPTDPAGIRFLERLPDVPTIPYAGRSSLLETGRLREIWFHITERCNQGCVHCLFGQSQETSKELGAERILGLASEALDLGCRVFGLTGGEPFYHREFERVVDGLLDFEDAHVAVLTNGTLLNTKRRFSNGPKKICTSRSAWRVRKTSTRPFAAREATRNF